MLRANLYKKFSKSNLPKATGGVEQPAVNTPYPLDEIKRSQDRSASPIVSFKLPDPKPVGPISMSQPWTSQEIAAYKKKNGTPTPLDPSQGFKMPNLFGNASDNEYLNQEQTLRQGEQLTNIPQSIQNAADLSSQTTGRGPQKVNQKTNPSNLDYNSMVNLGLGLADMGLGYNEDVTNQRILNESIQNRQSKPLYDYNYMYGRTTSGGTEYQPTIKAEMGAQITKRFNTPYGANNVEIEGGEFIQLPNFDTEHAEGPSHERGGIKTSLPEGTRVYSDHLKPDGSKKTFAQLAKKYDISDFKKVIDNPFRKQVDKDTATIMLKRNQKKLDDLFNDQQSMNGNSNGEMRDGGINNPGFQALPKAVQDQIIANMEYGGYQLPEYGIGGGGTFSQIAERMINQGKPGANLLNQNPSQQILGNTPTTVIQPHYDAYLKQKEAMLVYVTNSLKNLYNQKSKFKSNKFDAKIQEFRILQSNLESDIFDYNDPSKDKLDLIEKFFRQDVATVTALLSNPTIDNYFLAKDLLGFMQRISDPTKEGDTETDTGNVFTPYKGNKTKYPAEVLNMLETIRTELDKAQMLVKDAGEQVLIELLERHETKLNSIFDTTSAEEAREKLKEQLDDITAVDKYLWATGENLYKKIRNFIL